MLGDILRVQLLLTSSRRLYAEHGKGELGTGGSICMLVGY